MAQSALMTILKRGLLDSNTIECEICPTIEHFSYISTDEHLRNANISVSLLRFIITFLFSSFIISKTWTKLYVEMEEINTINTSRIFFKFTFQKNNNLYAGEYNNVL